MKNLLAMLFCLLPLTAQAFPAVVTKIADGDTFTVMADGQKQRIRVFGIDAPEHDQPFGSKAKADLSALILGKTVEVEPPPGHRSFPKSYDRIVAMVRTGQGTDIGWTMLTLGDAWAYDEFHPPRSYDEAMTQAASIHQGLWSQADPTAPWDWRHRKPHYRRH
ncbi:thermonuclease family protein [Lichenihabitans sp. Uapishka_5]|uniref:thermonuclease family protein n=1 Tax=Lichenihabitans sp. Uapishka_5 TaxID=3037302 RepID=UPI0029E806BD|nr:thermonuclease family protein [Lichenihabitans sp. Uapishka_5]MDX7951784.1 thermonuclease family protein [Lichenihabitans sp. Uapishka_5]